MKATVALLFLVSPASALRLPSQPRHATRRAALAGIFAMPAAAHAAPAFDKGELDLKPEKKKLKCRPDGFGGKICIDPDEVDASRTAPVYQRVFNAATGDAPEAASVAKPAAPTKAPKTAAPAVSKSSAPALTLDDMIQNSINSKADVLGRDLTPAEIADITAKVKKFMGSL